MNLLRRTLQNPHHHVLHGARKDNKAVFPFPQDSLFQCGVPGAEGGCPGLSISISTSPHAVNIEIPEPSISLPHRGQGMFNSRPQKGSAGMIELLESLKSCLEPLKAPDRQGGEVRGGVHHLPHRINQGDKIRTRLLLNTQSMPVVWSRFRIPRGELREAWGKSKEGEQIPFFLKKREGLVQRSCRNRNYCQIPPRF